MPSAISAASSASVPEETADRVARPRGRAASSRSSASTSGPMMNRWLSQTRVIAARISSRSGRYCACEIEERHGGARRRMSSNDDLRRAPQREVVVAVVCALPGSLAFVLKITSTCSPGVGRQIDVDRDPAAIRRLL